MMLTLTAIVFGVVLAFNRLRGAVPGDQMIGTPLSESWIGRLNTAQLVLAGFSSWRRRHGWCCRRSSRSFEVTAYPPTLLFSPTLENYGQLFEDDAVLRLYRSTA